MTEPKTNVPKGPLSKTITRILKDISNTTNPKNGRCSEDFDLRYREYQAEARALSLMIKAESDLEQRNQVKLEAAQKETYISYEDLPPLNPEDLKKLEKRFAHLAYETEVEVLLSPQPLKIKGY